jgi:hypothetical protein
LGYAFSSLTTVTESSRDSSGLAGVTTFASGAFSAVFSTFTAAFSLSLLSSSFYGNQKQFSIFNFY